jgi:ABC-2 type transport system permease protein
MRAARVHRLAWVEAKLFVREPLTVVITYAFPLIMLFALAEVFGTEIERDDETGKFIFRGVPPTEYYASAYVALVGAGVGLVSLPSHIAAYREHGIFRRFRASGFAASTVFAAQVVVSLAMAFVGAALVLLAMKLAYGVRLPDRPGEALVVFVLVVLMFSALGILLGAVLPTARAAQGAGILLFFVMLILSGAGPPPEVMSAPMQRLADVLPLTHAIRLLQDQWLGFAWTGAALAALAGFLVASTALALRLFRWE